MTINTTNNAVSFSDAAIDDRNEAQDIAYDLNTAYDETVYHEKLAPKTSTQVKAAHKNAQKKAKAALIIKEAKKAAKAIIAAQDAQEKALTLGLAGTRSAAILGEIKAQGTARAYVYCLIEKFGEDFYRFTSKNCRTDNEKAHLAAIDAEKKLCQLATIAKKEGDKSGCDVPWSRVRAMARKMDNPETAREGTPLDAAQRAGLIVLYKKGMKEDRPTEAECDANTAIGEILIKYFSEDLTKYGN